MGAGEHAQEPRRASTCEQTRDDADFKKTKMLFFLHLVPAEEPETVFFILPFYLHLKPLKKEPLIRTLVCLNHILKYIKICSLVEVN